MEDNTNMINDAENGNDGNTMVRRQYTKQQSALYTAISVALFCVLYFGGKAVMGVINRPYAVYLFPENMSGETVSRMYGLCGISADSGLSFANARLVKDETGYSAAVLFSGGEFEDEEEFAEKILDFEYGDPVEDVRAEFFPYEDNPAYPEYAFGTQYVNIDDPTGSVVIFGFGESAYAQYIRHGSSVPAGIGEVFANGEKVY